MANRIGTGNHVRSAAIDDTENVNPEVAETGDTPLDDAPLRAALKHSASALKRDGVPFALGGSYALWVHGAPEPEHDVDLVVTEADIPAAVDSLTAAGFRIERPPEDWLFKAYRDGALVDVLHQLQGVAVDAELVGRATRVRGPRAPHARAASRPRS